MSMASLTANSPPEPAGSRSSAALSTVTLNWLMALSMGSLETRIGLLDGPVFEDHPAFVRENLVEVRSGNDLASPKALDERMHGTLVAGILSARRDSPAPAICPGCTLLIRSIFLRTSPHRDETPSTTPEELAAGIVELV